MSSFSDYEAEYLQLKKQLDRLLLQQGNNETQINESIDQMKFYLDSMQQESIRTQKNSNKLKEYQNQMYQLTQDIREQGYISNAKKNLFGDAFNTAQFDSSRPFEFDPAHNNDIYVSHIRSNNQLLKAKQDIYQAEGYSHLAAGHIAHQNRVLDNAIANNRDNTAEFTQAEGLIAQMQRRINLNKCLLYSLYAFIFCGFAFIIIYKVFL